MFIEASRFLQDGPKGGVNYPRNYWPRWMRTAYWVALPLIITIGLVLLLPYLCVTILAGWLALIEAELNIP